LIVDWGDDSEPEIYTNIKNNIAHTYSNNTTYTIQIKEKELGVFYYNRHSKGHITSMDVSGCTALEYLNCGYNLQLTSLSISRCPALEFLDCQSNQLTSLYISECPSLKYLDCSGNQLADSVLNAISSALPSHSKMNVGWLKIYNNPGINGCDRTIAKNKGWWIDFTL
jgi:Leucine-rich repeat (LRR) protein